MIEVLHDKLEDHYIMVSDDVTRENRDPFWSGSFDRRELGKAVDYVVMMAYAEQWTTSPKAGSTASLPWGEEGIKLLMKDVPAHKIILRVPFFTLQMETSLLIAPPKGTIKKWDKKKYRTFISVFIKFFSIKTVGATISSKFIPPKVGSNNFILYTL